MSHRDSGWVLSYNRMTNLLLAVFLILWIWYGYQGLQRSRQCNTIGGVWLWREYACVAAPPPARSPQ